MICLRTVLRWWLGAIAVVVVAFFLWCNGRERCRPALRAGVLGGLAWTRMLAEAVLGTSTSRLRGSVNVTRTWSMQRAAGDQAFSDKPVTKVSVRTISSREGQVELEELTGELTVRELKQRVAHRLHISPRKEMTLRWWGTVMDDEKTLDECHVADGGLLELSLKNHTQGALEALKEVRQVRVRVASGTMVIVAEVIVDKETMQQVTNATTTGAINPNPNPNPALTLTLPYPNSR